MKEMAVTSSCDVGWAENVADGGGVLDEGVMGAPFEIERRMITEKKEVRGREVRERFEPPFVLKVGQVLQIG